MRVYLPLGDLPPWGRPGGGSWRFCMTLRKGLQELDVEVTSSALVRADVALALAWFPALPILKLQRLRGALIVHRICQSLSDDIVRRRDLRLLARAQGLSDLRVACSPFVADWMRNRGWIQGVDEIIPNPVDTDVFRPDGPRVPFISPSVVMLGWSPNPAKGQALVERLSGMPFNVYLCGDFSGALLDRVASSPNIQHFAAAPTNPVENPRVVASWLRSADCLFFPSEGEGFGNTVIEALACGTPVLFRKNAGAVPGIVERHGWAFENAPTTADVWRATSNDRWATAKDAAGRFGHRPVARRYLDVFERTERRPISLRDLAFA